MQTDKLFTPSLKGLSNYAKKYVLTWYFFLFSQKDISVCLSDCIPFPPSLLFLDVGSSYTKIIPWRFKIVMEFEIV